MPGFSFVHAADLHLDSPFVGLEQVPETYGWLATELRKATFKAYEAVVELCISEGVDFLLIAGDVYDGADRSLLAQLRFRDGLKKLCDQGIQTFVVHGNHDALDGWADSLSFPVGVHIFGPQLDSVVFKKNGVAVARIHGISYPTRHIATTFGQEFKRNGEEPFQIGLFHCNAGGNKDHDPYAPRTVDELVETGLDYWALGHIHQSTILRDANPCIAYPGNTQGRHVRECGSRGCFVVRVDAQGQIESAPRFVAIDKVRWLCLDLDISSLQSMEDLLVRFGEVFDELVAKSDGRPVVTRIALVGRGPLHATLCRPNTLRDLMEELHGQGTARTPFVWVKGLDLQTNPEVDIDALREGQDFLGDLLRLVTEVRTAPDQMQSVQSVVAEFYGNSRASKVTTPPNETLLRGLLDRSETRCVDLLMEDEPP